MTKIALVTRRKQRGFLVGKANETRVDFHVCVQEHNRNGLADGGGNQGVRSLTSALQDETVAPAAADHPCQSCIAFGPGGSIAQKHGHALPGGLLLGSTQDCTILWIGNVMHDDGNGARTLRGKGLRHNVRRAAQFD